VIKRHPGRFSVQLQKDVQLLQKTSLEYMDRLECLKSVILRDPFPSALADLPLGHGLPASVPSIDPDLLPEARALETVTESATSAGDGEAMDAWVHGRRSTGSISKSICDQFLLEALPSLTAGMAASSWISGSRASAEGLVSGCSSAASEPMSAVLADLPPPPEVRNCMGCMIAWPTQVRFQTLGRFEAQQYLDRPFTVTEVEDPNSETVVDVQFVAGWSAGTLRELGREMLSETQANCDAADRAFQAAADLIVGTALVLTVCGTQPSAVVLVFAPGRAGNHIICCRARTQVAKVVAISLGLLQSCSLAAAEELRKLPLDTLSVVSSMPALQEQFEVQGTSGDGDCALHAILGRQLSSGKWFLENCDQVRCEIQRQAVNIAGEMADRLRRSPDTRDAARIAGLEWWFLMQDGGDVVGSADIRDAVLSAARNIGQPGIWLQVPEIVVVSFCCKVKIVIVNPPEWACTGALVLDPGDCRSCVYLHNFGNWHWERTVRRDLEVTEEFLAQMARHTLQLTDFTVFSIAYDACGPRVVAVQLSPYGHMYMRRPSGHPKHELCISHSRAIAG